jgi:hypothetical protein
LHMACEEDELRAGGLGLCPPPGPLVSLKEAGKCSRRAACGSKGCRAGAAAARPAVSQGSRVPPPMWCGARLTRKPRNATVGSRRYQNRDQLPYCGLTNDAQAGTGPAMAAPRCCGPGRRAGTAAVRRATLPSSIRCRHHRRCHAYACPGAVAWVDVRCAGTPPARRSPAARAAQARAVLLQAACRNGWEVSISTRPAASGCRPCSLGVTNVLNGALFVPLVLFENVRV